GQAGCEEDFSLDGRRHKGKALPAYGKGRRIGLRRGGRGILSRFRRIERPVEGQRDSVVARRVLHSNGCTQRAWCTDDSRRRCALRSAEVAVPFRPPGWILRAPGLAG